MVSHPRIEPANPGHAAGIAVLLEQAGLSHSGVASSLSGFLVAVEDHPTSSSDLSSRVVGTVCIEQYDDEALLRSLAVSAETRGRGLGARLVQAAVDSALGLGCTRVVLLTTDATAFFSRHGFVEIDRAGFESPVTRSGQYRSECPASAVVMTRTLTK